MNEKEIIAKYKNKFSNEVINSVRSSAAVDVSLGYGYTISSSIDDMYSVFECLEDEGLIEYNKIQGTNVERELWELYKEFTDLYYEQLDIRLMQFTNRYVDKYSENILRALRKEIQVDCGYDIINTWLLNENDVEELMHTLNEYSDVKVTLDEAKDLLKIYLEMADWVEKNRSTVWDV